jgi:hypothetical protein
LKRTKTQTLGILVTLASVVGRQPRESRADDTTQTNNKFDTTIARNEFRVNAILTGGYAAMNGLHLSPSCRTY